MLKAWRKDAGKRFAVWQAIVRRRTVYVVIGAFGVVGAWDTIQSQAFPESWQNHTPRVFDLAIGLPWWSWIPFGLFALLLAVLEGAFHEISDRDNRLTILGLGAEVAGQEAAAIAQRLSEDVIVRLVGWETAIIMGQIRPSNFDPDHFNEIHAERLVIIERGFVILTPLGSTVIRRLKAEAEGHV